MDNYEYGLTPDQVEEVLKLGLTPWQFENVRTGYGSGNRAEVIEIFKQRQANGLPIPKPRFEKYNSVNEESAILFYLAIMIIAIIFTERWLIWIFTTIVYVCYITRHDREDRKRYSKYIKERKKNNE
jgi:hypothetical protein